jgi:hypothetical protein
MKLISIYTESHLVFKENWFVPSLKDNFDLRLHFYKGKGSGEFMKKDWLEAVLFKADTIIQSIKDLDGETLVYSDVDVQFFAPVQPVIEQALGTNDIVCQLSRPHGELCTGFFVLKANPATRALWEEVRTSIPSEGRDQPAFNRILRSMTHIRFDHFPTTIFGGGTFCTKRWQPGEKIHIPLNPCLHHANCTVGLENKFRQLEYVKSVVTRGPDAIAENNVLGSKPV